MSVIIDRIRDWRRRQVIAVLLFVGRRLFGLFGNVLDRLRAEGYCETYGLHVHFIGKPGGRRWPRF